MIIQISEDFRVRTEPLNFVLEERRETKPRPNGEPAAEPYRWVVLGYYSGLSQVFSALPDYLALAPTVTDYADFLAEWRSMGKQLQKSLSK